MRGRARRGNRPAARAGMNETALEYASGKANEHVNVSANACGPRLGLGCAPANAIASVSGNGRAHAHSETGISVPPHASAHDRARCSGQLLHANGNASGLHAHDCGRARKVVGSAERLGHDYGRDYVRVSVNASGRPVKEGSGTCASGGSGECIRGDGRPSRTFRRG